MSNQPKIEIYSKNYCPFCVSAKNLFDMKGVEYQEFFIDDKNNPEFLEQMQSRAPSARTVPQIFINDKHVGGFDDLEALDNKGELNPLLGID